MAVQGVIDDLPSRVVGLIAPWNGPAFDAAAKLVPSLAADCSSLLKPAQERPLSAPIFELGLAEAGVTDGQRRHLRAGGRRLDPGSVECPPARQAARRGYVSLSCHLMWDPAIPFGGYKQSGWGYENGQDGIEGYLETKAVLTQL